MEQARGLVNSCFTCNVFGVYHTPLVLMSRESLCEK